MAATFFRITRAVEADAASRYLKLIGFVSFVSVEGFPASAGGATRFAIERVRIGLLFKFSINSVEGGNRRFRGMFVFPTHLVIRLAHARSNIAYNYQGRSNNYAL
jgi:hypothetical protein